MFFEGMLDQKQQIRCYEVKLVRKILNEKKPGRTTSGCPTCKQGTSGRPFSYLAGSEYSYIEAMKLI